MQENMVRVCQVSLSVIDRDPRVLRTISALEEQGYEVIPVGYGKGLEAKPMSATQKLAIALRKLPSNALPRHWAEAAYWQKRENRKLHDLIVTHHPNIIHAHDWQTLPAAARAANTLGARLVYDSHEFAVGQRSHRLLWRVTYPAYIKDLEKHYIHAADHVITVSRGIADLLQTNYNLTQRPTVLRNTPFYTEIPFRKPDSKRILVHYHGIFTQGRGLRNLIKSVALWPQNYHLRLTGWGQPQGFETILRQLADKLGVADRVMFAPLVPHSGLVAHASEADIGICFWRGDIPQKKYTLPNKAFEYAMAGLMMISGPGMELKELVDKYGHGITLPDNRPESLADALAGFSLDQIAAYKQKALAASTELCWENEKDKLLAIYNSF